MDHNSLLLTCRLHIMTSFQRVQYRKRRKKQSKFTVEKPDKHYLTWQTLSQVRWWKLASTVISHTDSMYPWHDVRIILFYVCGLPPKKSITSISNHEKNIRQIPIERHSSKYLTSIPQKCQGNQKQGKVW